MPGTVAFITNRSSRADRPEAEPAPWPRWVTFALLLAATLAVYLPTALHADFLGFDDNFFFGPDNPEFRDGLRAVLDPHRPIANAYLPVAHASLWFDWWLFGGAPLWPHLHSLLLQALVGVVLVRLLQRLGVRALAAHLAGALFALHPALAESVVWVSGRKDLLAGLFTLLSLHQVARFARDGGGLRAAIALLAAALAMYAKATAVVLPLLALLVSLVVGGRRSRFVLVAALFAVVLPIAWHHQTIAAAQGTMAAGAVGARWLQVPGAYRHYVATAFWPRHLNVLYPEVQTLEAFRAAVGPGAVAMAGLLAGALLLLSRRRPLRLIGYGVAAFAVALLPFNTAFPASSIGAADRYLHLALPWLAAAVAVAAHALLGRLGTVVLVLAAAALGFRTLERAPVFADDLALWRASLAADDDNAVAHFNLALALQRQVPAPLPEIQDQLAACVRTARYPIHAYRAQRRLTLLALVTADYEAAARAAQGAIASARAQLAAETGPLRRQQAQGLLVEAELAAFEPLRLSGDRAGAEACYDELVRELPDHPDVIAQGSLFALARVVDELRPRIAAGGEPTIADDDARAAEADRVLDAAAAKYPDNASLWFAKASWDRIRGRQFAALGSYVRAQKADPQRVEPWLEAARMLRETEKYEAAAEYAVRGLRHRDDPALRQEWAMCLVGMGRIDDAVLQLEAYVASRPHDQDSKKILANVLIGRAYARLSEPDASRDSVRRMVDRALVLNPEEGKAHLVLGRLDRENSRFGDAVAHFEQAFKLLPDFADARRFLAECSRDLGIERLLKGDDRGAEQAFLRCCEVAPKDLDLEAVRMHVRALWRRHKDKGMAVLAEGDTKNAAAEFRRCLVLLPDDAYPAWPLAMMLQAEPAADLGEVERLCRMVVGATGWQEPERGRQVFLLAKTLVARGKDGEAKSVAGDYLAHPGEGAEASVLAALQQIAQH